MKAFAFALLAVIGIGIAAAFVLERYQGTADRAWVGQGARPDPEPTLSGKSKG